jgi:lincosamide nucleotidyltransferase
MVERVIPNFVNLIVFGMNTLQRGERARALELLQLIHRSLLWMARLAEQSTTHWPTPSKCLEKDLSGDAYARFISCTSALDAASLERAYRNSWTWGQELSVRLAERHALPLPPNLFTLVTSRFFDPTKDYA